MEERQLTDQSKKFIDDLRLYLFSGGKNDQEINEIAEELEDHLVDAELNGKSIQHIVGSSPQEYMTSISNEMANDYKAWAKYVPLIVMGAISFPVLGDVMEGTLSYSILQIIGTILYSIIFMVGVFTTFRYVAKRQLSRVVEFFLLLIPTFISMFFFIGLITADTFYQTPTIEFGMFGSVIIGIILILFVILFSIWAKTAILPVVLIAFHLPTFVLAFTSFSEEVQLITGIIITYLLIGTYLFFEFRRLKRKK
ncbi:HAAS domain-containing protein [Virgibacillus siamensis]